MINILILASLITFQASEWNVNSKGIAIDGYDPVSYFQNKPQKGSPRLSYGYKGTTFFFSSEANLSLFRDNPGKYAPKYGGYCAYAMGNSGKKVSINPETYKITNGKLYLFYNNWGNNTLEPWKKNEDRLKDQADKNWGKISSTDK